MPRRATRERRQREALNRYRSTMPIFTSNEQAQAYIDDIDYQYLINMKKRRERLEEAERLRNQLKNQSWCEWVISFFK